MEPARLVDGTCALVDLTGLGIEDLQIAALAGRVPVRQRASKARDDGRSWNGWTEL
jgi:hypothetical protein